MVIGENMKQAMISPQEIREYQTGWNGTEPVYAEGWRVAQVVPEGQTFPMADPIFWIDCADEVTQDGWVYSPLDNQLYVANLPPLPIEQPTTSGIETL